MNETSILYTSHPSSVLDPMETDTLCLLAPDDVQCGHVYFNELTRVLKFCCTYCRLVCEDINYFCQHLSEHINDDLEQEKEEEESLSQPEGELMELYANVAGLENFPGFDESKMVVEELDEADEIAAEVEEELRQERESERGFYRLEEENSCTSDFYGYAEATPKRCTDFERLIDHTTQPSCGTTNETRGSGKPYGKKKKKKVTTVKVIAFKNRVAELYERIKSEEEKRSKTIVEANENSEPLLNMGEHLPNSEKPIERKIIGETVITLISPSQSAAQLAKFPTNAVATLQPLGQARRHMDKTTCPACGKKFRSAFSLNVHKRTHYLESSSNIKLAHKCSDCDQLFNKISDLKEHIQEAHYPQGFICQICNKKLTSLTLLETHMLKVHLARPFNCKVCRKNFDTRERFEEHVTAHFAGQSYKCHMCGRKYSTECILKQHMRRHKERVPQCCVVCGKLTLRITQHMKIHAPRPKRVLSCRICGKVFNFSSGLSHHIKMTHKLSKAKKDSDDQTTKQLTAVSKKRNRQRQEQVEESKISEVDPMPSPPTKQQVPDIHEKEEEAKRVIVELIQNATYTSFLPENFHSALETGPPIAREETISAVNSIVNEE